MTKTFKDVTVTFGDNSDYSWFFEELEVTIKEDMKNMKRFKNEVPFSCNEVAFSCITKGKYYGVEN